MIDYIESPYETAVKLRDQVAEQTDLIERQKLQLEQLKKRELMLSASCSSLRDQVVSESIEGRGNGPLPMFGLVAFGLAWFCAGMAAGYFMV